MSDAPASPPPGRPVRPSPAARFALPLALALVLFVAVPAVLSWFGQGYYWQMANLALIFVLLAASLHVVTGVAGLLHLGHAAFYGVGAYTAGLLAENYGLNFAVTVPAAVSNTKHTDIADARAGGYPEL